MKNYLLNMMLLVMTLSIVGCGGGSGGGASTYTPPTNTPTNDSATLNWTAPSARTDGSSLPMNEIAGYKIYMGSSATNLTLVADIADAYAMEYKVEKLDEGTYYFAVSTYGTDSIESDVSRIVSKTI